MLVPEEEYTVLACCMLDDVAASWLRTIPGANRLSWQQFEEAICHQFGTAAVHTTDLMKFTTMKKRGTMMEYVREARRLKLGLPRDMSERDMTAYFLQGLPLNEKMALGSQKFRSFDELATQALIYCATVGDTPLRVAAVQPRSFDNRSFERGMDRKKRGVGRDCPYTREVCEKEGRCFGCGETGHRTAECPRKFRPKRSKFEERPRRSRGSSAQQRW